MCLLHVYLERIRLAVQHCHRAEVSGKAARFISGRKQRALSDFCSANLEIKVSITRCTPPFSGYPFCFPPHWRFSCYVFAVDFRLVSPFLPRADSRSLGYRWGLHLQVVDAEMAVFPGSITRGLRMVVQLEREDTQIA